MSQNPSPPMPIHMRIDDGDGRGHADHGLDRIGPLGEKRPARLRRQMVRGSGRRLGKDWSFDHRMAILKRAGNFNGTSWSCSGACICRSFD